MSSQSPPQVPLPADWARIHGLLIRERSRVADRTIPDPPVPLILAGASFSSAAEIRARWSALLDWAHLYGFEQPLLASLPPPPAYDVAAAIAGVSDDGKGWWPEYGQQEHDPKPRHPVAVVQEALVRLKSSWSAVVGEELAASTRPLSVRGRKSSHLIVAADPSVKPAWGSWTSRSANPAAFAAFRRSLNAVLAPIHVDHVTFNTDAWRRAA